jgi:hypothetical protein
VEDGVFSGQERFSIQSLLDDITTLRAAGKTVLDPWWLRLGWDDGAMLQDEEVIRRVLDEEHRRVQLVYAEIVQNTFPAMAGQMSSFTALPIRWKLTVLRRGRTVGTFTVYFHWLPVASWDEAGPTSPLQIAARPFRTGRRRLERWSSLTVPTYALAALEASDSYLSMTEGNGMAILMARRLSRTRSARFSRTNSSSYLVRCHTVTARFSWLLRCHSAWGPDADRRHNLLIRLSARGSHPNAYSHLLFV